MASVLVIEDDQRIRETVARALTDNGHAVRTEGWRYIRYANGGEELYDERSDPLEWTNLAADPRHASTKAELGRFLPRSDQPDIGGARPVDAAKKAARKKAAAP